MMHDWGLGWEGGMFLRPLVMIAGPVLLVVLLVILVRWVNGARDLLRDRVSAPDRRS